MSAPEQQLQYNVTKEAFIKNVEDMEKSILPAVLANTPSNLALIQARLIRNAKNGIIDGSFHNLRVVLAELHREKQLQWTVPPGKKAEEPSKELNLTQQAWVGIQKEKDNMFLAGAIQRVQNHHAFNHAKQARERQELTVYLRQLMTSYEAGKISAEHVEEKIIEKANSYFGGE